jgi:hypothetical protein
MLVTATFNNTWCHKKNKNKVGAAKKKELLKKLFGGHLFRNG